MLDLTKPLQIEGLSNPHTVRVLATDLKAPCCPIVVAVLARKVGDMFWEELGRFHRNGDFSFGNSGVLEAKKLINTPPPPPITKTVEVWVGMFRNREGEIRTVVSPSILNPYPAYPWLGIRHVTLTVNEGEGV